MSHLALLSLFIIGLIIYSLIKLMNFGQKMLSINEFFFFLRILSIFDTHWEMGEIRVMLQSQTILQYFYKLLM